MTDNDMNTDFMKYDRMVENALRGVVRQALEQVAKEGLPGDHHFYISFRTDHEDVQIPDSLNERYPEEMTIVLQHRFWDLNIFDEGFEVTLSFNKVREHLRIPFEAITAFVDPSVHFGLQFRVEEFDSLAEETLAQEVDDLDVRSLLDVDMNEEGAAGAKPAGDADDEGEEGSNVVTLDAFRNKKS